MELDILKWYGATDIVHPVLCASIHSVCNGRQYKPISALDFTIVMNLRAKDGEVEICPLPKEATRLSYMIQKVKNEITADQLARLWLDAILPVFDISRRHYDSHCGDPFNKGGRKNQKFVDELTIAFNNAARFIDTMR